MLCIRKVETKLAASCSQELQRKNYNKHLKKENCQNLEYRRKKERKYKLEDKMLFTFWEWASEKTKTGGSFRTG